MTSVVEYSDSDAKIEGVGHVLTAENGHVCVCARVILIDWFQKNKSVSAANSDSEVLIKLFDISN